MNGVRFSAETVEPKRYDSPHRNFEMKETHFQFLVWQFQYTPCSSAKWNDWAPIAQNIVFATVFKDTWDRLAFCPQVGPVGVL